MTDGCSGVRNERKHGEKDETERKEKRRVVSLITYLDC